MLRSRANLSGLADMGGKRVKRGYGDFFPIATRSGVGTTRLYISCTYPESLRSLSGSTVYLSTGTGMRIFFQLYAFQCHCAIATTALFTATRRANEPHTIV